MKRIAIIDSVACDFLQSSSDHEASGLYLHTAWTFECRTPHFGFLTTPGVPIWTSNIFIIHFNFVFIRRFQWLRAGRPWFDSGLGK